MMPGITNQSDTAMTIDKNKYMLSISGNKISYTLYNRVGESNKIMLNPPTTPQTIVGHRFNL